MSKVCVPTLFFFLRGASLIKGSAIAAKKITSGMGPFFFSTVRLKESAAHFGRWRKLLNERERCDDKISHSIDTAEL